jgi:hypothetical protein
MCRSKHTVFVRVFDLCMSSDLFIEVCGVDWKALRKLRNPMGVDCPFSERCLFRDPMRTYTPLHFVFGINLIMCMDIRGLGPGIDLNFLGILRGCFREG